MSKYSDPPESKELISQLKSVSSNKEELREFVEKTFPGWLLASTDKYCKDYPHLQQNWEHICGMNNVQPQKIVVVDQVKFDENHALLRTICDVMTQRGYVVRRKEEFTGCEVCRHAIPVREVWQLLKDKGLPVPTVWSTNCSECNNIELDSERTRL